jgi:phosphoribosyl-ATP pyrophosphohydrolase
MLPKEILEKINDVANSRFKNGTKPHFMYRASMIDGAEIAFKETTNYQYDFVRLANRHIGFAHQTFIDETPFTALKKLKEELKELDADLNGGDRDDMIKEYADCFFCLISSFGRADIQTVEILKAMQEKLEINIKRKWNRNPNGTYSHVKEPSPLPQAPQL